MVIQDYDLSIPSCLKGLSKAIALGWYNPDTFDADEYDHLDNPLNADMHVVTPKFLAFKGPVSNPEKKQSYALPPEHFIAFFKEEGVTAIVRLNEAASYDAKIYTKAGLKHYDLCFENSALPNNSLLRDFLTLAASEPRVAVHCSSGLGRTGTLIAAYIIRYHGFTASESIGWTRIVRPGSILGPQQQYLHFLEKTWSKEQQVAAAAAPRSRTRSELAGSRSTLPTVYESEMDAREGFGAGLPSGGSPACVSRKPDSVKRSYELLGRASPSPTPNQGRRASDGKGSTNGIPPR
jgi:protein-tyrosine phosphatase